MDKKDLPIDVESGRAKLRVLAMNLRGNDSGVKMAMDDFLKQMRNDGYSNYQIAEFLCLCGVSAQPDEVAIALREIATQAFTAMIESADALDRKCATCPLRDVPKLDSMPKVDSPPTDALFKCLPLRSNAKVLDRRPGVPDYVYEKGQLEHPAITGLMLSLAERLCWDDLAFQTDDGAVRKETTRERNLRIKWKKPIPKQIGSTSENFTEIDLTLFKKH